MTKCGQKGGRAGRVNNDKIKRNERKSQWASRYNDRLPNSTLESEPYADGEVGRGDDNDEFAQGRTGRVRPQPTGEFWNPEAEAFYNAQANASTDSGSGGRWHYPANFDDALPAKPKKKKDRWARTDDAHSIVESSDGRNKRPKKKKSVDRRDSFASNDYPEDAEGGVYGNEEAPARTNAESDIFSHEL